MTPPLTAEQRYLRSISESSWQRVVQGVAEVAGWRFYHAPDNRPVTARASGRRYVQAVRAGFPDLVLVKRDRLIFAELKAETGQPTPDQLMWLTALAATGAEVALWRPSDEPAVERVLLHGDPLPPWGTP